MRAPDELRQLTALRLLTIWRECGEAAEEPMERALLCNARVLAECCFCQGEPVFASGEEVLERLTAREMETLLPPLSREEEAEALRQLAEGCAPVAAEENPAFDSARFRRLQEG